MMRRKLLGNRGLSCSLGYLHLIWLCQMLHRLLVGLLLDLTVVVEVDVRVVVVSIRVVLILDRGIDLYILNAEAQAVEYLFVPLELWRSFVVGV